MHLWLVEHSNETLQEFTSKLNQITYQFESPFYFSNGSIKFFSSIIHQEINSLNFISYDDISLKGFSGLVIDSSGKKRDFRSIKNIPEIKDLNFDELSGQFSVFQISGGNFKCVVDEIGHHKFFYYFEEEKVVVSNNLELILKFTYKVPKDFKLQTNILSFHGYRTKFDDIYFLGTFQGLELVDGKICIEERDNVGNIYNPEFDFEKNLENYYQELLNVSNYLTEYHRVFVDVSGGFDSRVVLSMFYGKNDANISLFTYNRQSSLDFYIAKKLNKAFNFKHFLIELNLADFEKFLSQLDKKDSKLDPFKFFLYKKSKEYFLKDEIPVKLNGNGGGTDWAFQFLAAFKSDLKGHNTISPQKLLRKYVNDQIIKYQIKEHEELISDYFSNKFKSILDTVNSNQKIASAVHLEHVIFDHGFSQSQLNPDFFHTYSPFASRKFFKLIFSSDQDQLIRGNKTSIHYRLYDKLTHGVKPFAPILRENDWYDTPLHKIQNYIFPLYAKILWKIQGGDINTQIRKKYKNI
jgi:hypothetical protein